MKNFKTKKTHGRRKNVKTGQINTIIMQKYYKCTARPTDIQYVLYLKSCYEPGKTGM